MKTLAIVSSYSESCGNASFTKVLHDTIIASSDFEVEVIELNLQLLQSIDRRVRKLAKIHVAEICHRLKAMDAVNIQVEAGLYGTLPSDVVRRVKEIMSANKNTTLTLHSPRLIASSSASMRAGIKNILKFNLKTGIKEIINSSMADINIRINKKIIHYAVKHNRRLIVHTSRAREQIYQMFKYENIDVHPLKIVPENIQVDPLVKVKIKTDLGLSDNDLLIGMFGYISAYKGHLDALRAMKYLPKECKLLIFGRQHPQTLKSGGTIDHYLSSLINTIESNEQLHDRVFFMGELTDQEFLNMASSMDIAWLPYYENGQDGSGIASICMDVCKRVLCSTSFAFDELFKLVPYENQKRFDIGNAFEMATKTMVMLKTEALSTPREILEKYSLRTQVAAYIKDMPLN